MSRLFKNQLSAAVVAMTVLMGCESEHHHASLDSAPGPKPTVLSYIYTVKARPEDWQHSGIVLKHNDAATLIAAGTWFVVRDSDSGGNGSAADGSFAQPGASEGCLILGVLKDGQIVDHQVFEGNGKPLYMNTAGEFVFLANDSHHPDDDAGRHGYKDNHGSLDVTIKIKTLHPEEYPPTP